MFEELHRKASGKTKKKRTNKEENHEATRSSDGYKKYNLKCQNNETLVTSQKI